MNFSILILVYQRQKLWWKGDIYIVTREVLAFNMHQLKPWTKGVNGKKTSTSAKPVPVSIDLL